MPKPPPGGKKPGTSPDDLGDTLLTGFQEIPATSEGPRKGSGQDVGKLLDEELGSATKPQWSEPSETMDVPPGTGDEGHDKRSSGGPRLLLLAAIILAVAAAALIYRNHHRQQVLAQGMDRARQLIVLDTYAGYRDASQILEPLVAIDPLEAGSMRAFALSMLAMDYRDEVAAQQAESLLLEPERSPVVPPAASLARAALSLAHREAGTAAAALARAGENPWAGVLQARSAMLAGNLPGAVQPLESAAAGPNPLPMALALKGDVMRRGKDPAAARALYQAALKASPNHPRAVYGLAKLALAGRIPPVEATEPLHALLGDRAGTPGNERARAALHLAALRARAGQSAAAAAAIDLVELDARSRSWMERAVREEELRRGDYRVVDGAPAGVQSASDDDPYEPPPPAPVVEPRKGKKATVAKKGKTKPVGSHKAPAKVKKKKSAPRKGAVKKSAARQPVTR